MGKVDSENRQIMRDSLFVLATIRFDGLGDDRRVRIRNLSSGGLMAEGQFPVAPGQELSIELRNAGWVDGHVAWVQGSRFGIAFHQEIDAKVVRASTPQPDSADGVIRRPLGSRFSPPDPKQLRKI
jgi:prepilin-type processing-associated H-X9-DG protein